MQVGCPVEWRLRSQRLVDVVKTVGVGGKRESPQESSWEGIGKSLALLNVEQLERPGTFTALFDFIEEKPIVRRDSHELHRSERSGTSLGRVDEQFVSVAIAAAHIDTGLLL